MRPFSTAVAITDPLIKYHSLVSTGLILPDLSQHRLALQLQKVYHRLKDYTPSREYSVRLAQITKAIQASRQIKNDASISLSTDSHPARRNPLFARWFSKNEPGRDTRALVKVLTGHQAALDADSPRGLFLSGEVGTGKSMLLDLLAEGLPTKGKRRWHFNTFMLHVFSQLERYRKQYPHLGTSEQVRSHESIVEEYSLLWVAKGIVETSPILFLDEFQLPDRAAAKIVTNLFTVFFQLGGVLVASSNRMPEDLENATGTRFVTPAGGGIISQVLGLGATRKTGELFGKTSDFAMFLEVLKARCEFWHMEGGKDWRRREQDCAGAVVERSPKSISSSAGAEQCTAGTTAFGESDGKLTPAKYYCLSGNCAPMLVRLHAQFPWAPSSVTVYGRCLTIPRQYRGISVWNFEDLVGVLGPADYMTLASTFHTFIIDRVPVLTLAEKNEARRFITLLDALYECRCKLIVRAEAGPDDLFFPDQEELKTSATINTIPGEQVTAGHAMLSRPMHNKSEANRPVERDEIYSETISEVYQDATAPFRPNITTYSDEPERSTFNDQDMDFEDTDSKTRPNFQNVSAFTGEDERFAYKRAASRLWEMCSERWHARGRDFSSDTNGAIVAEEGETPGWWTPLPNDVRHWEESPPSQPRDVRIDESGVKGDISFGPSFDVEEPAGLERLWKRG